MGNSNLMKWKLKEITLVSVVSIALGVIWWGWTFVYNLLDPVLRPFGLNYLVVGFWFIGGTLLPYIIRKPGAAFFAETLAAVVEGFITQWGITAIFWGMAQGALSELVFAVFRYKKYNLMVMILSGIAASIGSYILDFFYNKYYTLGTGIIIVQIIAILISGAFLGGFLAKVIGDALQKTGILDQFLIAQDSYKE